MFSGGKDSIFVSNLIFQATRFLPFSFEKSRGRKIKILFKVETIYDCLTKHHMIGRTDWHCLVKRNACLRCRNVNSGDGN